MRCAGIDPGVNGGVAVICLDTGKYNTWKIPVEGAELIQIISNLKGCYVVTEKIQPRPSNSLRSVVTSCVNWGMLKMALIINDIESEFITPSVWQKELGLSRKWDRPAGMTDFQYADWKYAERKKWHREEAKKMFPKIRVTHQNADALLIAEYARRVYA